MRKVTLSLLVPLLASGCGSSPASPTPVVAPARHALSLALQFSPDAETGKGWRSPTAVSLRATIFTPPAVVESAVFRMVDDRGEVLAEASIAVAGPVAPDAYMDGTTIVQTLTWPAGRGYATRLDLVLLVRGASGERSTVSTSIPAR